MSGFHALKERTCSRDGISCRHERNFLLKETECVYEGHNLLQEQQRFFYVPTGL
jgi:hypothetical protein